MGLKGLLSKLILPVVGMAFISGCFTYIGLSKKEPKFEINYNFLRDWDGDGIPDIYDIHPYFYDYPLLNRPYHNPHFHPMNPWYHTPPDKTDYKKSPPKVEERKKDTKRLRDNSGERNSKGRR
ncbi:MAG: hypothetical protein Q8Q04_03430 [archaeon]|nr:hypothetical protein [archaeon]